MPDSEEKTTQINNEENEKKEMKKIEFKLTAKDIRSIDTEDLDEGLLVKGVPVFKVGKYGGKDYDSKFIDEKLIKQFDPDEDIPFQSDHSDSSKDTLGYIRKIVRDGDMAFADMEIRDDNAIARWKKGLMKKFSIGFYNTTGKLREISAVAFPRVKEAVVHSEESEEKVGEKEMAEKKESEELLKEAAEMQEKLEKEKVDLNTKLSEKDVAITAKDAEIKKLMDGIRSTRIDGIITALKVEGKILPAIEEKTKVFMLTLDDAGLDKLVEVLKEVKASVKLGEEGTQSSEKTEEKKSFADSHTADECMEEAEKRSKTNGTSYDTEYDKLFEVV